jgi:hypothetical protein
MKFRREGGNLLQERISQFLPGADRNGGNIIDGFFGVKLGALPARSIKNIHQMAPDAKQPQFKHGKQPNRAGADDDHIGRNIATGRVTGKGRRHARSYAEFARRLQVGIAACKLLSFRRS